MIASTRDFGGQYTTFDVCNTYEKKVVTKKENKSDGYYYVDRAYNVYSAFDVEVQKRNEFIISN